MARTEAALDGPSKMPQPWMQAYSVPERSTPRRVTRRPWASTRWAPTTWRPRCDAGAAWPAAVTSATATVTAKSADASLIPQP